MLAEIEKNEQLANTYSKYELVRIVFTLLKQRKHELDKNNKKNVEITKVIDEIIADLANGKVTLEEIEKILKEQK